MAKLSLAVLVRGWSGSAYTESDHVTKNRFHLLAGKRLRELAKLLELAPGSFDVRSNKAGPAVAGEVTLHTERLYLRTCIGFGAPRVLFRTCKGLKDYTGGANNYMPLDMLDNPERLARDLKMWLSRGTEGRL